MCGWTRLILLQCDCGRQLRLWIPALRYSPADTLPRRSTDCSGDRPSLRADTKWIEWRASPDIAKCLKKLIVRIKAGFYRIDGVTSCSYPSISDVRSFR